MDGTLIDSEPYWIDAEKELAAKFGVDWTDADGPQVGGKDLKVSAEVLMSRGIAMRPDDIIEYLLSHVAAQLKVRVPWHEDSRALLESVSAAAIPCALVTMSYSKLTNALVKHRPETFAVIVTGDRVKHGEPHREAYLMAARELGVRIEDCVAVEDSHPGVASAYAGGAVTIGVRRLTPIVAREGLNRVYGLEGWTVEHLAELANGRVIDELGSNS
jgi:HAD superfamily hydrolase (TIGR01509 family)